MSASTQTRRLAAPSTANVLTRAIIGRAGRPRRGSPRGAWRGGRSKRPLEVVQADQAVLAVQEHADGGEAQVVVPRALGRLGEPGCGHLAHLGLLLRVQVLERLPRPEAA